VDFSRPWVMDRQASAGLLPGRRSRQAYAARAPRPQAKKKPAPAAASATNGAPAEEKESLLSLLWNNVLTNPYIWGMALTYFCIYVVRQGVTSWFVFYLLKVCRPQTLVP
jgi:hypothetical protein